MKPFKLSSFILFGLVSLFSCRKDEAAKKITTYNKSESVSSLNFPLIVASSDKSTNIINAINGNVINYYSFLGDLNGNQSQSPLFTDTLIINFFGNSVFAMRIKDSTIKWKTILNAGFSGNGYQYTSYSCINNKLVMFYSELNLFRHQYGVYGLNLSNGKIEWVNKDFIGSVSIPAYANNTLVINGYEFISLLGYMYAIDATTGKTKWKIIDSSRVAPACIDGNKFYYAARTDNLNGSLDTLFSRNVADGSLNWKRTIPSIYVNHSTPLVSGNYLYINLGNELLCADKNTGATIWEFKMSEPNYTFSAPYFYDDKVFINEIYSATSYLISINAINGKKIWARKLPTTTFTDGPVVMNNTVYLRDGSNIDAFDPVSGALIFKTPTKYYQTANPAYSPTFVDANGNMVYSTESGMH
ncbi:MAG: PQQ-binding-like beta-propeller repeat protein [Parafilimonas sp.]